MSIHDQPERPDYVPEHLPWPVPKGWFQKKMKEMGYPWQIWVTPRNPRKKRKQQDLSSQKGNQNNYFYRLQQTEEGRALWKMWTDKRFAKGVKLGRPQGATEGYLKTKRDVLITAAKTEAKEIVKYMENTKGYEIPKQEFAKEAIVTAVEIMRRDDINVKDKLTAAKTVLEWTLSKPATETTVNVVTAESFLEDIAAEMAAEKK